MQEYETSKSLKVCENCGFEMTSMWWNSAIDWFCRSCGFTIFKNAYGNDKTMIRY